MLMKNRLHIFIFLLLMGPALYSQDVHFSQYYFSPLTLNPANTGNFKGDYRFFGNYRSQWREISRAYNTFSAGGDMNFYPNNQNVSAGLFLLNDMSGGNLSVTKIMSSAAAHKKIAGFLLHAGIQPGIVINSIDFYANSFPNQLNWDKGKFDNTLPNNESNVVQRKTYFDLNFGFAVSKRLGKFEPEFGFAMFHITKPKNSFLKDDSRLSVRQASNFGLNYYLNNSVILRAYSLIGSTTKASDWVTGVNVEYVLSQGVFFTNSVFAGFMWRDGFKRNTDAGIITAGVNYSHYTIGFSYDITFSQLKTSNGGKGAFEIALLYRSKNTRLTKKVVPCERY
jgi:type IX secretion system PorP/SprF family membrane protein